MSFQQHMALAKELASLKAKGHPRVSVAQGRIVIDTWCDGDAQEAERVMQVTRRVREMFEEFGGPPVEAQK